MRRAEPGERSPKYRVCSIRERKDDPRGNCIRANHERAHFWRELGTLMEYQREASGTSEADQTRWLPVLASKNHAPRCSAQSV